MDTRQSLPGKVRLKRPNHVHIEIGDRVQILNQFQKKESIGVLEMRGNKENGHFLDVKHGFGVRDLKDNSIKWLGRSEIKKISEKKRASQKISGC